MRTPHKKDLVKLISGEDAISGRGKSRRLNTARGKSPAPANHPWRQYKLTVKHHGAQ